MFKKLRTVIYHVENLDDAKTITDVGEGIKVAILKDPFGSTIGLIEEL